MCHQGWRGLTQVAQGFSQTLFCPQIKPVAAKQAEYPAHRSGSACRQNGVCHSSYYCSLPLAMISQPTTFYLACLTLLDVIYREGGGATGIQMTSHYGEIQNFNP